MSVSGTAPDARAALDELERLAGDVTARLGTLAERVPAARAFAGSALADHARLARERAQMRRRLRLPAAAEPAPQAAEELSLDALRAAQDALVFAQAESLPALVDHPTEVDRLARQLVDLARHLALIDLWIASEAERG